MGDIVSCFYIGENVMVKAVGDLIGIIIYIALKCHG